MRSIINRVDTLIYGFVGPFGVLYVFPRFFLSLEETLGVELPRFLLLKYAGITLALWLLIWSRFAAIYIARYEEPYLISVFGEAYRDYCNSTPRWFPSWKGSRQ